MIDLKTLAKVPLISSLYFHVFHDSYPELFPPGSSYPFISISSPQNPIIITGGRWHFFETLSPSRISFLAYLSFFFWPIWNE